MRDSQQKGNLLQPYKVQLILPMLRISVALHEREKKNICTYKDLSQILFFFAMINASKHDGLNVYLYKKRQKTRRYFMTILDLCPCLVRYFRPGPHVGDCVCVPPCWLMLLGLGWIQGHETCQTLQIQIEKKTRAVSLLHHMLPSERCVTLHPPEQAPEVQIVTK